MATPVLYHIEVSHYNEKARWALDYKGVPHRRKAPMPMAHMAWAMAMTRGQSKTFPILRMNGDTIHDSTKIIERLEHDYPEPPLYPDDPDDRRRALELEEFFDEELAPHIRRAAFAVVTRDADAFAWIAAPRAGQARALRAQEHGRPRRAAGAHALRDQRRTPRRWASRRRPPRSTRLESEIGPSGYLVGQQLHGRGPDRRGAVLPARAAAGVRAPHARRAPRAAPGECRPSTGGRPGWEWVREMYRRHRGTSAAVAYDFPPHDRTDRFKGGAARRAPVEWRQAGACARHLARRERRPGGLGARARGLSRTPARRGSSASPVLPVSARAP